MDRIACFPLPRRSKKATLQEQIYAKKIHMQELFLHEVHQWTGLKDSKTCICSIYNIISSSTTYHSTAPTAASQYFPDSYGHISPAVSIALILYRPKLSLSLLPSMRSNKKSFPNLWAFSPGYVRPLWPGGLGRTYTARWFVAFRALDIIEMGTCVPVKCNRPWRPNHTKSYIVKWNLPLFGGKKKKN